MPNGSTDNISNELIDAIANSTAMAVGEQPAILSNLALANQIANTNLAQQNALSNQQAMFQLELTIVSKCVELIANINPTNANAAQQLQMFQQIMQMFAQMNQGAAHAGGSGAPATSGGAVAHSMPMPPQPQPKSNFTASTPQAASDTANAKTERSRARGKRRPPGSKGSQ
ncbi:MAG TPA: hypothetical protein VF543_08130 [Pyrinomonadaceae bacterium]|jgi:hypothetical protein